MATVAVLWLGIITITGMDHDVFVCRSCHVHSIAEFAYYYVVSIQHVNVQICVYQITVCAIRSDIRVHLPMFYQTLEHYWWVSILYVGISRYLNF